MRIYDTLTGKNRSFPNWSAADAYWYGKDREAYTLYICILPYRNVIPFKTKEELQRWWLNNCGLDFRQLNMTGNDMMTSVVEYEDYVTTESWLRPYMVFDSDGRIIDIRSWSWQLAPQHHTANFSWLTGRGSRSHTHRKGGPSMYRQTLRAEQDAEDHCKEVGLDDRIRFRKRARDIDVWDYVEYAHAKDYIGSKSWKDQTKAARQYGRHKPFCKRAPAQQKPDEDLIERLSEELLTVSRV